MASQQRPQSNTGEQEANAPIMTTCDHCDLEAPCVPWNAPSCPRCNRPMPNEVPMTRRELDVIVDRHFRGRVDRAALERALMMVATSASGNATSSASGSVSDDPNSNGPSFRDTCSSDGNEEKVPAKSPLCTLSPDASVPDDALNDLVFGDSNDVDENPVSDNHEEKGSSKEADSLADDSATADSVSGKPADGHYCEGKKEEAEDEEIDTCSQEEIARQTKMWEDLERRKKKAEKSRAVACLRDYTSPGLNDQAPNLAGKGATSSSSCNIGTRASKKPRLKADGGTGMLREKFDEPRIRKAQDFHADGRKPICYDGHFKEPSNVEMYIEHLALLRVALWMKNVMDADSNLEHDQHLLSETRQVESVVESVEPVIAGRYFKGHVANWFSEKMSENLPPLFQVKSSANQKGMFFFNAASGQCTTHYDRDDSVLLLLTGHKEVMIAPPPAESEKDESGFLMSDVDVDPFDKDKKGQYDWKTMHVNAGDALFIPKGWVHCVKSERNTLALSLQVEARKESSLKKTPKREPDDEASGGIDSLLVVSPPNRMKEVNQS